MMSEITLRRQDAKTQGAGRLFYASLRLCAFALKCLPLFAALFFSSCASTPQHKVVLTGDILVDGPKMIAEGPPRDDRGGHGEIAAHRDLLLLDDPVQPLGVERQDGLDGSPIEPQRAPKAYLIPADRSRQALVDRVASLLERHGISVERLAAAVRLTVETATPGGVTRSERVFQGHREVRLTDVRRSMQPVEFPAGSLRVSMGQPLARLVFHLLEPTSDDSVITWNVVDDWLAAGEPIPIYRLLN